MVLKYTHRDRDTLGGELKRFLRRIIPLLDLVISVFLKVTFPIFMLFRRIGPYRLPKSSTQINHIAHLVNINSYYGFYEQQFRDAFQRNAARNKLHELGIDFRIAEQLQFIQSLNPEDIEPLKRLVKSLRGSGHVSGSNLSDLDLIVILGFIRKIKPKTIIQFGDLIKEDFVSHEYWSKSNKEQYSRNKSSPISLDNKKSEFSTDNYLQISRIHQFDSTLVDKLKSGDLVILDFHEFALNEEQPMQFFLRVLPQIPKGAYVLLNDVYTPYEYLDSWAGWGDSGLLVDKILRLLLSNDDSYEVVLSLNLLAKEHTGDLEKVFGRVDSKIEPNVFVFKVK